MGSPLATLEKGSVDPLLSRKFRTSKRVSFQKLSYQKIRLFNQLKNLMLNFDFERSASNAFKTPKNSKSVYQIGQFRRLKDRYYI